MAISVRVKGWLTDLQEYKTIVVAAGLFTAGLLLAVWLWTERTAYQVGGAGEGGFAYLVDRRSGEVWVLVPVPHRLPPGKYELQRP